MGYRTLAGVSIALMLFGAQAPSMAQPAKTWRIAFLNFGSPVSSAGHLEAFRRGLRDLGYVEGQNIAIDLWWAEGQRDRLPHLTSELLRRNPDVIIGASTEVISAARRSTSTVPIVMASGSDPVTTGLVASLARPGGNITGLSNMAGETTGKLVDIVRELVPAASRAVVLLSSDRTSPAKWSDAQSAGKALKLGMELITVTNPQEIESAIAAVALQKGRVVLIVPPDSFLASQRRLVVRLAADAKLPAIYARDDFVREGGLISYGLSIRHMFHRSASYVDRIFKGAKPADLPIEQPTKFDLVVNRTAAKALGLPLRRELVMRADEMID